MRFEGVLRSWQSYNSIKNITKNYVLYRGYKVPDDYQLYSMKEGEEGIYQTIHLELNGAMFKIYQSIELEFVTFIPATKYYYYMTPIMQKYAKYGADDTEPRTYTMAFIEEFIVEELQKRKNIKKLNLILEL